MTMRMRSFLLTLMAVLAAAVFVQAAVINEVRIDNPGADTDEYFELSGTPGESLDGLTYIVIGDGAGGSGVIESVTDLTGQVIQADGLLAVHKSGTTGTLTGYDVDLTLNFENSDNVTHMLVSGFSGALNDDVDLDDDGVMDVTPWDAVVDCVAFIETVGSGDLVYCDTQVGPDGSYVPGHIILCDGDWYIGDFGFTGQDTPGELNTNACIVGNQDRSWGSLKAQYR